MYHHCHQVIPKGKRIIEFILNGLSGLQYLSSTKSRGSNLFLIIVLKAIEYEMVVDLFVEDEETFVKI